MELEEQKKRIEEKIARLQDRVKKINKELDEQKPYFAGVTTWSEAIELLQKANTTSGWSGRFVEINGDVYFDLGMANDDHWSFARGRKLI